MKVDPLYIDINHVKGGCSSSNIYRINSSFLIDAGSRHNAGLKEFEDDFNGIESVVITFAHETHTDNLEFVDEETCIYAAEPGHWSIKHYASKQNIVKLEDKKAVRISGENFKVRVFESSETKSKKLVLYSPAQKILFSGDAFPVNIENRNNQDLKDYLRRLEYLSGLEIEEIYPAHGEPITEKAEKEILTQIQKVKSKIE